MKAAEIIMQQRKNEKENEEAKRKMAYDIIRYWVDENKDYYSELLLKRVIKKFTEKKSWTHRVSVCLRSKQLSSWRKV